MTIEKKPWYKSKTKWAALLIGVGPVLITLGGIINGSISFGTGMTALATEVGIVLGILGIRDLPFINRVR